ncbi:hypothetical protein L596_024905 [Steinernema carpocapsae]|uniref:Uncharacterized protein n=1 Tax=Steinernema carpocapsae TaxID=34508 RepID=A0A4U5M680_STECR|nr:hypothetical protein L596_024905 [Steinernema carpocapsae]
MDRGNDLNWLETGRKPPVTRAVARKLMFSINTEAQLKVFMDQHASLWNTPSVSCLPPLNQINMPDSMKYELANDVREENDKYEMELVNGKVSLNISKDWHPPHPKDDHVQSILKKPKTFDGEWAKNADSWQRRKQASLMAQSDANSDADRKLSASLVAAARPLTLNQSMIFKKYEMDDLFLRVCEDRMRVWIRNSVVKPLADEIEKLNEIVVREKITPHIKIGHNTLEQLQQALQQSHALHSTVLSYLIPYLRVVNNQEYLVSRVTQLATDVAMRDFKWQGGGSEVSDGIERKSTWNEQLPTDSELIWMLFCVFMDTQLTPQSLAITENDTQKPFTHTYTVPKAGRNAPIQRTPQAFYISMISTSPPHFQLFTEGGRTLVDCGKGGCNLFKILVLFFRHAQLFNNDAIDQIHLSSGTLNISRIFASYI